ncbi:MAG TPA: hypothetical protein VF950_05105 [Planctomycetota bacterium]
MKRAIPLLILLGLGGVGAWWIWTSSEPGRRYKRVLNLLSNYRGLPAEAWAKEDVKDLWAQVSWYGRRDPEALVRRLLASLDAEDVGERGDATLLAAHIRHYSWRIWDFKQLAWHLPLPVSAAELPPEFALEALRGGSLARRADDPRPEVRLSFLELTQVPESTSEREAFLALASRDVTMKELWRVFPVLDPVEDADARRVLEARAAAGEIRSRLLASATLAARSHPAGTRIFVELLTDLGNDIPPEDRALSARLVAEHIVSLESLLFRDWAGLDEWRSWLEIREHEDFRADAQIARDAAWKELTR